MKREIRKKDDSISCDDIRDYIINHKLIRPKISWLFIVTVASMFELFVYAVCIELKSVSAFSLFFYEEAIHIAAFIVFGHDILRMVTKIYQRYAPSSIRRQCTCLPTCSEYALLVLDKYCWPKALVLIIRRMTKTCQQPGYKIDFP
ncbi:MAG: membrane protein insertion efficiency factor YidD [Bacteroidaceae bacterium]|nr:membrane protein insertion efficiency factor YidD [Bacteroidaceae bacterium]